jgi:sugar phosphate isomerase/epimerase
MHRVDGYAQQYKMIAEFHNHDATRNPNQSSNAASFEGGLKSTSRWADVNLDIGHFAANSGPASFLKAWRQRAVTLPLKDCKRNHGANVPWGEGDTPIVAVLRLVQTNHRPFSGNVEYEYGKPGMNTITEVTKHFKICGKILTTNCRGKNCYATG